MNTQKNITFQNALDIIETLPEYQQEDIVDIIHNRLIEHRRDILAGEIKAARDEFKRGEVKKGSVDSLMKELSE